MKSLRLLTTAAFVLAVVLVFGVMTVSAQGPTGSSVAQIAYLDNQSHTLGPNSSQLFRFDYALNSDGTRSLVTIRMPNAAKSGLGFEIWTPDQLRALAATAADAQADPTHNQPIGRGTAAHVNCDTGVLDGSASCISPDLTWTGNFGSSGPYYVRVVNSVGSEANFKLNIDGKGVGLGQPQQQVAVVPPSAPAAAPALAASGADPANAQTFDTQMHNVAAGGASWFKFDYALKDDGTAPVVTIRMPNGYPMGLAFEVWTAEQLHAMANNADDARADPLHNQPIGRGTAAHVNCDTGVLDASASCISPDLIWKGAFGSNGTYYVKVVNPNTAAGGYQLVMATQ